MLILSRRIGEKLIITTGAGEHIEIETRSRSSGQVTFGIDAPQSVIIDREEIHERKQAEQEAS